MSDMERPTTEGEVVALREENIELTVEDVKRPTTEDEAAVLRENIELTVEYATRPTIKDEVVRLREENTALKVENATLRTNITWLKGFIWGLISICLILLGALVIPLIKSGKKSKKGSRKGSLAPILELVKRLLKEEELREILNFHLVPDALAVLKNLGVSASADDFFHKVLNDLQRRGLLSVKFFEALEKYAPTEKDYIRKVQAEFFGDPKDEQ